MSITTDVHDSFFDGINEFYHAHIKKEKLNHTAEGNIVAVLGNNQYTVKINNIAYTIPGTEIPNSNYLVGMIVWIEIPNQNFSHKYIKCKKPY